MARLVGWFKYSLNRRPVLTNTAVYAAFYTAAELSQQSYNKISNNEFEIDIPAAVRIVAVGSTLYAPTLYHWYKFLDKHFKGTSMKTVLTKVCLDQFTMTPVLIATFFSLLGILEGKDDVFEELKSKYWKAFFANQLFWIPGQTINFYFVPSTFRVVYVASASFIWINVMVFIKRQKINKIEEYDMDNKSVSQESISPGQISIPALEKSKTESPNSEIPSKMSESTNNKSSTEIDKRESKSEKSELIETPNTEIGQLKSEIKKIDTTGENSTSTIENENL